MGRVAITPSNTDAFASRITNDGYAVCASGNMPLILFEKPDF
jgi:hypothetical protein